MVRGEKEHPVGDVLGRAQPFERDAFYESMLTLLTIGLPLAFRRRVGAHEAWRHVVDRDAPRSQLVRQLPREADLRSLRRRVRLDAGKTDPQAGAARDVDDAAAAHRLHSWRNSLCEIERAGDVDVEDALPLIRRHVLERTAHLTQYAAGVVHKDVHAARCHARIGDHRVHGALVAHVHFARGARSAGCTAELLCLEQLVADHVAGPHTCAALAEREADRTPEAVGRAGNDGCLAAEVDGHCGLKRLSPGTSRKSLMFSVHNAAFQRMAHAAMARSISRPRGARTTRYKAAAAAASSGPNAIAASAGQSASCAANSSGRRGPRCHSYSTRVVSATRSPLSIVRRSAGAERWPPANASIRTDVSSRITLPTMTSCVVH